MKSGDAYINKDGNQWVLKTPLVERVIIFDNGIFYTKSIKTKKGTKLSTDTSISPELLFSTDSEVNINGLSEDWSLIDSNITKLKHGEMQLDIKLQREDLQVTKSYVVFPKTSIIREWATFKNIGESPVKLIDPGFLNITTKVDDLKSLDFNWMTGAENWPGSWKLKKENLSSEKPRKFDSYDPFQGEEFKPVGDGVNAKIMLNGKQIWPETGWAYTASASVTVPFDLNVEINAGDKLVFLTNINEQFSNDTTAFDPTIKYSDGETHTASAEFSGEQVKNGWQYQYLENGEYIDLTYYSGPKQWRKKVDNNTGTPFVGAGNQHPHPEQDVVRVWTAPKAGKIQISGSICNTGNGGGPSTTYGFRTCTQSYAPWYALFGNNTKNGMFIGWDYFGHWISEFTTNRDGSVNAQLRISGYKKTIEPGESVTTPKAFTGFFKDDLDDAGNVCLDWQYRYMWDYTRDDWFPAVRMLGYWMKGTSWSTNWTGGNADWHSAYQKIFRTADLMRSIGADVYHRDWGWWDRAGDWNGPDFRSSGEYLRKYDMGQLIYAFLYTVDPESKVAREHPDWLIGSSLDMSMPETIEFMKGQLDTFYNKWGRFEWRNDSIPFFPREGDETVFLGQDQGFRKLMKDFLDKHDDCAFQAVNGGGYCAGYDYIRYSSTIQFTDGGAGLLSNYYASMLFPPDKTNHMPDSWDPARYDPATYRGLLSCNFDMTGDTWDPAKLEGLRDMINVYHYLETQGVVGRWVKVYRPVVTGDNPTMYFQRMSSDNKRGIIITKHLVEGAVTVKPKGLLPDETYFVSFHESKENMKRNGSDLMKNGISMSKVAPGELIYLNLSMHPGSKLDKENPTAPTNVTKRNGTNMGYIGVEIAWKPGKDNNWISYYEIIRDGIVIDKLAKGSFYFDHSAGADLAVVYEVRAVDGAGNKSNKAIADGQVALRSIIYNDQMNSSVIYNGTWNKQSDLLPAYEGTISSSNENGSYVELAFEGNKVMWFTKLGPECGKATISIDGNPAETVDTYAADDVWGVCMYNKSLEPGKHIIRVGVSGDKGINAKDTFIYIDGFRIEQ
ncbi:MAG: alpha-amylase family protein [Armatimonadota bacterium]